MRLLLLSLSCAFVGTAFLLAPPDEPAKKTATAPSLKEVNYAEHVAPILDKHCVDCHRPGEVAPFSLVGYDNAKKWAKMAASVTEAKRMPPWKATHGYGEFLDENLLTPVEIETLKRWSEAGGRRGDSRKEPAARIFAGEWAAGQPDLVASIDKPFRVPAEGQDVYRNFVLRNDFKETLWVTGLDVKPGNKKVVHHVIAFLDKSGRAIELEKNATDGLPGYGSFGGPGFLPSGSLGGWAPGLRTRITPAGTAFRVDPGTKIVLQIHYHPTGKEEMDQTKIGLYTSKVPVTDEMHLRWMLNPIIAIPAGAKNHKVVLENRIRQNITLHGLMPHMHLLGRSMKAWVELPDGSTKPLIDVQDWDFNWQLQYLLKQPMKIPAGSKIKIESVYDNSSDNPNNPSNPPRLVTFGEATTDEMMLLVGAYTIDRD